MSLKKIPEKNQIVFRLCLLNTVLKMGGKCSRTHKKEGDIDSKQKDTNLWDSFYPFNLCVETRIWLYN